MPENRSRDFAWASRAEADQRERLPVEGHAEEVPGFGVDRGRLAQSLGCTVEVACGAFQLAEIGQRRLEPDLVADLAGDGDARRRRTPLFAIWLPIAP